MRSTQVVDVHVHVAEIGTAFGGDFAAPVSNHFHHTPAIEGGKRMFAAVMIEHENNSFVFF
jgi:hypothetical protein